MATLDQILGGISITLTDRISPQLPEGLHAYPEMPSSPLLPAITPILRSIDYGASMGRSVDDVYELDLQVLCSTASEEVGQALLRSLVTGYGPLSIRETVEASKTRQSNYLGLPATKARVMRLVAFGLKFRAAEIDHVGAILRLQVITAAAPD